MCNESNGEWLCKLCGAVVDAEFDSCWKCGASRDGTPDPDFAPAVRSVREELHCKHCGYFLRGLPSNHCPECGEEFDPDAADTEPVPRDHERLLDDPTRRFWLNVWAASWGLLLTMGLLGGAGLFDDLESVLNNELVFAAGVVFLLALFSSPIGFIVSLLPKHGRVKSPGFGPTQPVAEARRALDDAIGQRSTWSDAAESAATELARALLAAGTHEQSVVSELRQAGLTSRGAWEIRRAACRPAASGDDGRADGSTQTEPPTGQADDDVLICPHCAEPIDEFDHFCPSCTRPVTAHASMDPLGQVYSAGHAYYRAVTGRPRLVIVLAMWLIFGPPIPFMLFGGYMFLSDLIAPADALPDGSYLTVNYGGSATREGDIGLPEVLEFLFMLAMLAICSAVLWKVTNHYYVEVFRTPRRRGLGLCAQCAYDMRGTIAAGKDSCPECGAKCEVNTD